MKTYLKEDILYINRDDVPHYKKEGSVVRNSYFWALRSISGYSRPERDWEFEPQVWFALSRMLLFFTNSGYLPSSETTLEFPAGTAIPEVLRPVSTYF